MKYLVVLLVVLAVLWLIRSGSRRDDSARSDAPRQRPARPAQATALQDMIECPVCHVHLPRGEALPGPGGQLYCCAAHRARAEG